MGLEQSGGPAGAGWGMRYKGMRRGCRAGWGTVRTPAFALRLGTQYNVCVPDSGRTRSFLSATPSPEENPSF